MDNTMTRTQRLASLTQLVASGGPLNGTKTMLFQNNVTPTKTTVLADLTIPTYTGYVAQTTGTFGAPYVGTDGLERITAPGLQFQPSDDATPNTIYGYAITNTAGTVLIAAKKFDTPVSMADATSAVVFQPEYVYGK